MSIQVFPTRNIHFVTAFPTVQMDLSICIDWPPTSTTQTWSDLINDLHGIPSVTPLTPSGGTTVATATVTLGSATPTGMALRGNAVGAQFYLISMHVGTQVVQTVLRVATHPDVAKLHVPYGDIFVFVGTNSFVLTVFADFTDGESWDVSEHPYLEFSSVDPTIATIDATGRIAGVAPGQTTVTARPTGRPAMQVQCIVHVDTVATWVTAKNIVVTPGQQPAGATRKLFVLAEGYVDPARFDQHSSEIVKRIFEADANAPFHLLSKQFAVTRIYVRSGGTRGISVGPPLDSAGNGRWVIHTGDQINTHGTYQPASLSAFGLIYGQRLGDVDGNTYDSTATPAQNWIGDVETRSIAVDLRRVGPYRVLGSPPPLMLDPRMAFESELKGLLNQLQLTLGDNDRIVFLVDDQIRGGAGFSVADMDIKQRQFVSLTIGTNNGWFDGVQPQSTTPIAMRVPVADNYHADYVAASVAHELGHTYRLGDEYESKGGRLANTAGARNQIEEFENLELIGDLVANFADPNNDPPPPYDLTRLKWRIPLATKASYVVSAQRMSANTIVATVAGDATIWKVGDRLRIRTGFATPRATATDGTVDPNVPRLLDYQYDVQSISGSNVTLTSSVSGSDQDDVSHLSVLYLPVGNDVTNPVHIMVPAVESYVTTHGAFPRPAGLATPCTATEDNAYPPSPIPGFTNPAQAADVVGVYQGGYFHSCGVVRPTGRCRLRVTAPTVDVNGDLVVFDPTTHQPEINQFCAVCKFVIADQVDPSVLPKLK